MDKIKKHCPVCDSLNLRQLSVRPDLALINCMDCGLVTRGPIMSAGQIEDFYRQGYHDYYSQKDTFNAVYKMKFLSAKKYLEYIKTYKPSGRLLDIGCAYGQMLEAAKAAGFEACGIELSREAGKYLNQQGYRAYNKPVEEVDFTDDYFDVITMIDLLEHIPEPRKFFLCLARILKKGGLLFIITPNVTSLAARVMNRYWPHYQKEHLCYYSKKVMAYLLKESGFEIIFLGRAHKYLTFDYVLSHFRHFIGGWPAKLLCQCADFVPRAMKLRPVKLPTEMLAVAKRAY